MDARSAMATIVNIAVIDGPAIAEEDIDHRFRAAAGSLSATHAARLMVGLALITRMFARRLPASEREQVVRDMRSVLIEALGGSG